MKTYSHFKISTQLAVLSFLVVMVVIATFTGFVTQQILDMRSKTLHQRASSEVTLLAKQLEAVHRALAPQAERLSHVFAGDFPNLRLGSSTVDVAGTETRILKNGEVTPNNNFTAVDHFSRLTHGAATVFVRSSDDFVRITTTLK